MQTKNKVAALASVLVIGTTMGLPQTAAKTTAPFEQTRAAEMTVLGICSNC